MQLFLDSANINHIETMLDHGLIRGITTNPTHIRSAVDGTVLNHFKKLIKILKKRDLNLPLSVQVMTLKPTTMLSQARRLVDELNYPSLVIKIPIGWRELEVIHKLQTDGITVNCTACMTEAQALLGASAGAKYVSLFYGKMGDAGINNSEVVKNVAGFLRSPDYKCELIVGSVRTPSDFTEMIRAGAHIVTLPYEYFELLANHHKTIEAVEAFAINFLKLE